jgi:ubiquinone/menaquinone biosynthesis C-methylase UbiE
MRIISRANATKWENQNPSLKAVTGNCFYLPFRNSSFDVAIASLVLSQLSGLEDAVSEIARVLKPGGLFAGWDPNPFNPIILYRYLINPHSRNQYLFWPHKVRPVFEAAGFATTTRFFYAKIPGREVGFWAHA